MDTLEIDGDYGEGGGQILRSSLSLSAILQRPIRISNIRAGRKKPGLAPQHLTCVNAVAEITNAAVMGGMLGSQTLTFHPQAIHGGNYTFDVADIRPMALAKGESRFTTSRITRHLTTNIWLVQQFLPVRFEVNGAENERGEIVKMDC